MIIVTIISGRQEFAKPMYKNLLKREESYAPHAPMAQVLRKLLRAKFFDSKMGRSGGIILKIGPDKISLLDVVEVISGRLNFDTSQTQPRCATQQREGHCNLKIKQHNLLTWGLASLWTP